MRYLGLTDADRRSMLDVIGADTIDALYCDVPDAAVLKTPLDLPAHAGEMEVEQQIAKLVSTNRPAGAGACFLGAGSYRHHVPASVDYLIQRRNDERVSDRGRSNLWNASEFSMMS